MAAVNTLTGSEATGVEMKCHLKLSSSSLPPPVSNKLIFSVPPAPLVYEERISEAEVVASLSNTIVPLFMRSSRVTDAPDSITRNLSVPIVKSGAGVRTG